MDNSYDENEPLAASYQRSPRPQFNYFYGSTSAVTSTPESINTTDEQDSLVGEQLISTDNECDLPTNGDDDSSYQQDFFVDDPRLRTQPAKDRRHLSSCSSILIFLLAAGMISISWVVLFPPTRLNATQETQTFETPFPQIDRADFGDPVENFLNMDLFASRLIRKDKDATTGTQNDSGSEAAHSRSFSLPFPTGAFWTNLVVSTDEKMSYPVAVYPFAYRWSSSSLQVSYPAGNRIVQKKRIQDPFLPELTLSTKEKVNKRHVVDYDPVSVTLRYISSSPNAYWETALVQGNPYVTITYTKQTPVLKPLSIFSDVQCPGDTDDDLDNLSKNETGSDVGGGPFGVCGIDVRTSCVHTLLKIIHYKYLNLCSTDTFFSNCRRSRIHRLCLCAEFNSF